MKEDEDASGILRALGVVSADERAADGEGIDRPGEREANGGRELGVQQQSGWDRFFGHGLITLIPDTGANGGGCLVVYDDEESVKKLGSEGETEWERSHGTDLNDLIPVSDANGGGYLIAFDHELIRMKRDGSPQWRQTYGGEGVGRKIRSVIEAGSDGFVFVGDRGPFPSVNWVVKISGNGTVTWQLEKYLNGDRQGLGQFAYDIHRARGGGYLIYVRKHGSRVLMKVDESGAFEWSLEFVKASDIYVTDEGSILVAALYDARLIRVTGEGTRQWTNESEPNLPNQILEGESGFLVAKWDSAMEEYSLEMLRDDGTRRWWQSYDQGYTIEHGEPDGYVLFGSDSVLKIHPDGSNEWERPLYVPTDIEYLYHLEDGGYLLGGIESLNGGTEHRSWIAMRENLAGGVAVLPDVNGDGNPSQDPDGDGLYEDVNGDGSVNVGDAQALYNNRDAAAIQINGELYDFNNDGEVNVGDAQALFAEGTEDD